MTPIAKDLLNYDRRLKTIGKVIKSSQIKDTEGTLSPGGKSSDQKKKSMLGQSTMYSLRVRQIMKEREKQVKMEKKNFSNRASVVNPHQVIIEEEMLEQSPSPKVDSKATPMQLTEEPSNLGEFGAHA